MPPRSAIPAAGELAQAGAPTGTSVWVTVDLQAGRRYRLEDAESGIRAAFTPR